jgi:hypothetical protein
MRLSAMLSISIGLVLALAACERAAPPSTPAAPGASAGSQPAADDMASLKQFVKSSDKPADGSAALPAGHPPIGDMGGARGMPPADRTGPQLKYTPPAAWQKETPTSALRADQYKLPRAAGDTDDGQLAVFAGGIGGSVEQNIERWKAQFTTPDGQPMPPEALVRESFDVHGLKVTLIDIAGTFNAGAMSMGGGGGPQTNYRMLGGIVETPGGPWYFKATGPTDTLAKYRDDFVGFLKSMKLDDAPAPAAAPAGAPGSAPALPPGHP